jgi:HSP20 family protein
LTDINAQFPALLNEVNSISLDRRVDKEGANPTAVHHPTGSSIMAKEIKKTETGAAPVQRYIDPFSAMRADIDHVFDSFLGRGFRRFPMLSRSEENGGIVPSVDVRESETEIVVEAELPGMDEKDVSVTLNNGVLTLKGEKKSEHEEKKDDYHLTERSYGSFQRSLQIADTVDADKVKATFDKGVLKVTMPKRPEAVKAEKRIPIGKA